MTGEKKEPLRICANCQHFEFVERGVDWSEVTPGDDAMMFCRHGYWDMTLSREVETRFRRIMRETALTCRDFEAPITND